MDTSAFTSKFVEEARDRLKAIGNALVKLEAQPQSPEIIKDIFREAHSLKGSSQMLGFVDISQIAHQLEELFIAAKRDASVVDTRAFDLVFRSLDLIGARVDELAAGKPAAAPPPVKDEAPQPTARAVSARKPTIGQSLRVSIDKLEGLTRLAPEMVIQSLKASERHAELRRVEQSLARLRDRVREARLAPSVRSRVTELGEYADGLDGIVRQVRALVANVSDDQARLTVITEELRQHVIELTMLPVGTVFDAFPRAVRDLSKSFGKEVELTLTGRDTELEKRVIEKIADPLVHLVRNAIDHGLEPPDERLAAGKPAAGALRISAEQHGNRVQITVRDDGHGIDPAALRAAAARKGIASIADLEQWSHERLFNLIFEPGFSTRTETTDISGRGVGMDVVRVVADTLGGAVRVQSELGRGTTVLLDLPLSLALLRVVLVEVNGESHAIPTAAIRRILHASLGPGADGAVIEVEGESIPAARLGTLLGQSADSPFGADQTVMVLEARDGRMGIVVDAVLEEQELVFQELRGPLGDQLAIAGAALLGNGDIVPIVDVQALHERIVAPVGGSSVTAVTRATGRLRPARVLVVEDSLVAAEMHRGILVAAGYEVQVAHDGAEAIEVLRHSDPDIVITDLDMPNLDGFELTIHLRADDRLQDIPIVIVSSRDTAEHRRRGLAAGADAYVTKGEFDQNAVLATVKQLVGARPRGAHR